MFAKTIYGAMILMFVLVQTVNASGIDHHQKYFNDTASKVKATSDPVEKREILNTSLQHMVKALDQVQSSNLISKEDSNGIDRYKANLKEKQDELMGTNGHQPVASAQLNAFSDNVAQDFEQAEQTITISLVVLLLIIIILILL